MDPELQLGTDEELARQTQAGSFAAYEELLRRHETRVYRFLCQCCRNETDARELTQDTFVAAFNAMAQFNPRLSFATWLFAIARRKFIDHRRSQRFDPLEQLPEPTDPQDPALILEANEAAAALWQSARQLLPDNQFQALWFRCQEELEIKEIAQALRLTRVHVKVLLFRARQTLMRALDRSSGRAGGLAARPHEKGTDGQPRALPPNSEAVSAHKPASEES